MKIWDFLEGIVAFLGIKVVMTPPAVSMPSERGVTSIRTIDPICSEVSPIRMAAWTAAP